LSLDNKTVLITGITGFIGSHMARYLIDNEATVFGFKRRRADGKIPQNIGYMGIENEMNLIDGDLEDFSSVEFCLDESNPDLIFHFASQSSVQRSFSNPFETMKANCIGTANLLEAIRIKGVDPKIVFAGSCEEYGIVISSREQYKEILHKHGVIMPEPKEIPELPVSENSPLRPISPYAISKVYGDQLMRNYYDSYGLKTIVSRGFNHEGPGRGIMFVTSTIVSQIAKFKSNVNNKIMIGNINACRDWSHITDMIKGYCLLAEKGNYGDAYNLGSERTNSVLSYILLSLEAAGYLIDMIETVNDGKKIKNPTEIDNSELFGLRFQKTKIDKMMIEEGMQFNLSNKGIIAYTNKGKILIEFDKNKFRPVEVPLLLSNTGKVQKLGFKITHTLEDIIVDQLNYFTSNNQLGGI